MKTPIEMVVYFCTVQLEILKERELHLRKQIEENHIQREFLKHVLENTSETESPEKNIIEDFLHINRRNTK
jgi:hypothetical protein